MEIQVPEVPSLEAYVCPTCGETSVNPTDSNVLCQSCVNLFLSRNVGLMRPVAEVMAEQEKAETKEKIEKIVSKHRKENSKKSLKKAGTG
jgi:uncharacterized Zn finger protein (UPF0148 family)